MTSFVASCLAVLIISAGLVLLIRRNLRQREAARRWRNTFMSLASDLVSKPEFPEAQAKQLTMLAVIPGGWLTRYMVAVLFRRMITGHEPKSSASKIELEQIPVALRTKYVAAIFAVAISDSYRCALLGRIWRGAYSWTFEAAGNAKPDVTAHATRSVISQVSHVHADRQFAATERRLEACAVA